MSCFFSFFFFSFHFFCNTVNCACYWPRRPLASQSLTRFTTGERKREIAPATAFHQALLVSVVYTVVTPVNTKEPGEPARAAPAGCQQHQQRLSFVGNVLRSIQKSKKEKKKYWQVGRPRRKNICKNSVSRSETKSWPPESWVDVMAEARRIQRYHKFTVGRIRVSSQPNKTR